MRRRFRNGLQRALEFAVVTLMVALALVVVLGVVFRRFGAALVWYDEVASILLAWLTFYGAALAALHRAHIGFPKLVDGLAPRFRRPLILLGEVFVLGFFMVTAWAGWRVFGILGGETLVSLPWVPQRLVQSVIPIGAILFIFGERVRLPEVWAGPGSGVGDSREGDSKAGDSPEHSAAPA
ncbi:MAG: TRAP transporter small permease [Gemmatimonadota bacterium]|nr:TRAP transporter small permease [Gemmatimonadota bacterium]